MKLDVAPLVSAVKACLSKPLLAVGSGGSFSAATFLVDLHERFTNQIAKALTPLQLVETRAPRARTQVVCLSAGGGNPDIRAALTTATACEENPVLVVCATRNSPLAKLTRTFSGAQLFDFELPSGRDGFLATNSLLAFSILFGRAYCLACERDCAFDDVLLQMLIPGQCRQAFLAKLEKECQPLWTREHLVVLHGLSTRSSAQDLESKFVEAALGAVLVSDYRNFAHGRHHWLAKRGDSSGVLAFITEGDSGLAEKTLCQLPPGIPIARIHVSGSPPVAGISAMISAFHVVSSAGKARSIDPGRPGVPGFGRRIFNLRIPREMVNRPPTEPALLAIHRKLDSAMVSRNCRTAIDSWKRYYQAFCKGFVGTSFGALVLDYDGTLCSSESRSDGPVAVVIEGVMRLLSRGIRIGIATGRGRSVREALQRLIDRRFWTQMAIGYYNGAECAFLDDDSHPDRSDDACQELIDCAKALEDARWQAYFSQIEVRRFQIALHPKDGICIEGLWTLVNGLVSRSAPPGVKVLTSTHSIDILAPGISKLSVIQEFNSNESNSEHIRALCIGDRGRWPGNDHELLSEPHSLSVDQVSPDPETCWNLAPRGLRGIEATLHYLKCMEVKDNRFVFRLRPDVRQTS